MNTKHDNIYSFPSPAHLYLRLYDAFLKDFIRGFFPSQKIIFADMKIHCCSNSHLFSHTLPLKGNRKGLPHSFLVLRMGDLCKPGQPAWMWDGRQ